MGISYNNLQIHTFSNAHYNSCKQQLVVFRHLIWVLILLYLPLNLKAQNSEFEYFSDYTYHDYPIITFKENFFNQPVYYIDGIKVKQNEVKAFMDIMPSGAKAFSNNHTKLVTGTALRYASLTLLTGSFVFLFTSDPTPQNFRTLFFANITAVPLGVIGTRMGENAKRKNSSLIENYNYLVARESISGPYLRMDVRFNFIGEKIDIYDGPNLLDKARIRTLMEERPDMYADYQKALKMQKVSFALDLTGLSLTLLTYAYLFTTQFQSSTPSKLAIPFVITTLGLNLTSSQMRRRARNLTRHALDKYNFGENYIPVVKHQSMEFTGPSVTLFNRSF